MNDLSGKTNDDGSRTRTPHAVSTRDEWRDARLRLLAIEKEHTRRSDELTRRRQELPWVRVDKDYRFQSERGPISLADLFGGRSQLLVHHFMFTPSHDANGCPSCSAIADGYDGFRVHLENHDVALAAVSRTSIDVIAAYKKRMGWSFPWVSSADSDFNFDFGVSFRENQLVAGRAEHNFRPYRVDAAELPHGGTTDGAYDPGESHWRERLRARRWRRVPHLLRLRAWHRHPLGHVPVARPGAARPQRTTAPAVVPPPRRVRRQAGLSDAAAPGDVRERPSALDRGPGASTSAGAGVTRSVCRALAGP
jgi:predicted dithiol-disulfide oxidoreductase (DUF899 family)